MKIRRLSIPTREGSSPSLFQGGCAKNSASTFRRSAVVMPFSKSIGRGFLTRKNPSLSFVRSALLANFAIRPSVPSLMRSGNDSNSPEPVLVKSTSTLDDTLSVHVAACGDHGKDNRPRVLQI